MYHQIRCKPGPVKWQPENSKNNEQQLSKSDKQLPVVSLSKKQLTDDSQSKEHLSGDNQSNLQLSVPSPGDDSEPDIVFISCPLKLKSGHICGKQFSKPGL